MRSLLEADRHPLSTVPPARLRRPAWVRWAVALAAGALFVAALGYLIPNQLRARDDERTAQAALTVTKQQTRATSAELAEISRDLSVLKTQVGSDTTALNQDAAQLLGAQTSLSAAQTHVSQQATLITSMQACLVGVEQALNQLAIGKQAGAIAALNAVASSCATAEASSG
jgi:hypothetical protein